MEEREIGRKIKKKRKAIGWREREIVLKIGMVEQLRNLRTEEGGVKVRWV